MTEESSGEDGEADASHAEPVGVVRGLLVSVIGAARTRLDLAAVEAEIFLLRSLQMLLWAFAAVACGLLALAFAVVAVVAALWDTHRMLGVLCGAGLFFVLAGAFSYIASRTFASKPHLLAGTLTQLETDQHRASGPS